MADPADVEVGRRIREMRIMRGMSQTDLGNALGVSFQQVQKYEKGTNRVGSGRLWRIAGVLDVPITYFFENLAEKSPKKPLPEPREEYPAATIRVAKLLNEMPEGQLKTQVFQLIKAASKDSA